MLVDLKLFFRPTAILHRDTSSDRCIMAVAKQYEVMQYGEATVFTIFYDLSVSGNSLSKSGNCKICDIWAFDFFEL